MNKRPFIFGIAASGENFTDRKGETARLEQNFLHGINTILISPRRWGKTSLVRKVCDKIASKSVKVVYLDIFACRSEADFYNSFATAVLQATCSKLDEILDTIRHLLSRISPKIQISSDPTMEFSLSMELGEKSEHIEDLLNMPEKIACQKGIQIVICIDEFQQIADFNDSKSFQKKLRSVWQLQKRVSYCLFGSKKHLMNELFEKRSLPFYKFGDVMYLGKIDTLDWVEYICSRFKATGKSISPTLAEKICSMVENHSSYVQQLSWLVWIHTDKEADINDVEEAYSDIINQNTPLFEKQTESLTSHQISFLRAIIDGVDKEFTSQEVLKKYQFNSSANVSTIKRALEKKEIIEIEQNKVDIPDPIMKEWLKREVLK